ncbi:MAG: RHS repeat protein [Deltaproteobacteria bacterium]|jgi:hypothetical protein|nr:RHS repeat protein [Deltaproteobacteria bacterium]
MKIRRLSRVVLLLIVFISWVAPDATSATITYSYDAAGRLTEANYGDKSIKYTYDSAGNIVKREVSAIESREAGISGTRQSGSAGADTSAGFTSDDDGRQ